MRTPRLILAFLFAFIPTVSAQTESGQPAEARPSQPEDQQRSRRDRARPRDRQRDRGPRNRREFRIDRMFDRAARMYELDEAQKVAVRQEMEAMQAERRAAMGAEAVEYDQLRDKLDLRLKSLRGDDPNRVPSREDFRKLREDPEWRAMRDRLRTIERNHPFDWEHAITRVEALLPADQAAKGRAKWEARFRRRDRGSDDRRRLNSEQDPRFQRNRGQNAIKSPDVSGDAKPAAGQVPPAPLAGPRELHPWEIHVKKFIDQHQLSTAQANSAMAILKDMRQRAEQLDSNTPDSPASGGEIAKKRDAIFDEMNQRLDALLTASQRAASKKP